MSRFLLAALCCVVVLSAPALAAVPAGGGGGGPGEPPPSNLRVEKAADTVILTDGTKITGTILAAGLRAIIVIEQDQTAERVIKRSEIESFSYAAAGSGEVKGYTTGVRPEEGLPVIVGEGSAAAAGAAGPQALAAPRTNRPPTANRDLGKLWTLLGGNAGADELKTAIEANPQWRGTIGRALRGEVPPEGADAIAKFMARLAKEPELSRAVKEFQRGQKTAPGPKGGGEHQKQNPQRRKGP